MVLAGRLEAVPLAGVLQILSSTAATGILTVEDETTGDRAEIELVRGKVIRAVSSGTPERLGATLVRRRAVPAAMVGEALKRQSAVPPWKPLGVVLMDMGALDEGTLVMALADQMERNAATILGWERGVFRFRRVGGNELPGSGPAVALETGQLLMQAARFADERTRRDRVRHTEKSLEATSV